MSWASLLPRDPDWAYILWSADALNIASAEAELGSKAEGQALVARLYVTGKHPVCDRRTNVREVVLSGWSGHTIAMLGPPGSRHQVALGLRDDSGRFTVICRSEPLYSSRSRRSAVPEALTSASFPEPGADPREVD